MEDIPGLYDSIYRLLCFLGEEFQVNGALMYLFGHFKFRWNLLMGIDGVDALSHY